jgi:hypothetical protein
MMCECGPGKFTSADSGGPVPTPMSSTAVTLGVSAQRDEKFHRILDNPFRGGTLRQNE